ncbi:MAG: hypothetical protein HYT80_01045 [Euryarchaeota archaeon]|nr:hypothetical protein [Euryarchaeota archaeon]
MTDQAGNASKADGRDGPDNTDGPAAAKPKAKRKERSKESPADPGPLPILFRIVKTVQCFHSALGNPYVSVKVDQHWETWPLTSGKLRSWLGHRYYEEAHKAATPSSLQAVLEDLEYRATVKGPQLAVNVRIGSDRDRVYVDLGRSDWQVVEIDDQAWRVIRTSPVRFRRPNSFGELPIPVRGGKIEELRPFLNVGDGDDQNWHLAVAFLLSAFNPTGPYPALVVTGEWGAAKSMTSRVLRSLIDPNGSPLRGLPRSGEDLAVAAENSWCPTFDNVSAIPVWLSDEMCRLTSGGGFGTRKFYTNDQESALDYCRPLMITALVNPTEKGDFLSRQFEIALPPVAPETRKLERKMQAEWVVVRPRILGVLFDAVSMALRNRDRSPPKVLPRLADVATWISAAEPGIGLPAGTLLGAMLRHESDRLWASMEEDEVAWALWQFGKGTPGITKMTASALLAALIDAGTITSQDLVQNPARFGTRLRLAAATLRLMGLHLSFHRLNDENRTREVHMRYVPPGPSTPSTPSSPSGPPPPPSRDLFKTFVGGLPRSPVLPLDTDWGAFLDRLGP